MRYVLMLSWWLMATNLRSAEPSFIQLPDIPGGETRTFVHALSANGEIAVGQSGNYPFVWTMDTGMVALGVFPGAATDVSADGNVVVGYEGAPGSLNFPDAVFWIGGERSFVLQPLRPVSQNNAWGVSADGATVVGESDNHAVLWEIGGRVRRLVSHGIAEAVSADGSVVAGTSLGLFPEAFIWTARDDRIISLGSLPGDVRTFTRDMTPDGRIIVGVRQDARFNLRGFRWTAETGMAELGFLPMAVSDDGRIMIGSGGNDRPVIWTEGTGVLDLRPFLTGLGLDLTGWTLTDVTAISGDGTTIAGQGVPPEAAMSSAWIATIPEPSTLALGGTALAGMVLGLVAACRRR